MAENLAELDSLGKNRFILKCQFCCSLGASQWKLDFFSFFFWLYCHIKRKKIKFGLSPDPFLIEVKGKLEIIVLHIMNRLKELNCYMLVG